MLSWLHWFPLVSIHFPLVSIRFPSRFHPFPYRFLPVSLPFPPVSSNVSPFSNYAFMGGSSHPPVVQVTLFDSITLICITFVAQGYRASSAIRWRTDLVMYDRTTYMPSYQMENMRKMRLKFDYWTQSNINRIFSSFFWLIQLILNWVQFSFSFISSQVQVQQINYIYLHWNPSNKDWQHCMESVESIKLLHFWGVRLIFNCVR